LAADAATEILPDHRLPAAERLEFAGHEEGCPHLLASDDRSHQGADQPLAMMAVGAFWLLWIITTLRF
jgi:hypothetical protein